MYDAHLIDIDMDWTKILQNLGMFSIGTISIVGVIGYFGRSLFEQYLREKLSIYRSQLDRESDHYKHQLQMMTQEHQIIFSKLHADRSEVIRLIYEKLQIMNQTMRAFVAPIRFDDGSTQDARMQDAAKAAQEYFEYFRRHDILFDEAICTLNTDLENKYGHAWATSKSFNDPAMKDYLLSDSELKKERVEALKEAWKIIDEKVPIIEKALKIEFRNLLGVIQSRY